MRHAANLYYIVRDGRIRLSLMGSIDSDGTFRGPSGELVIDSQAPAYLADPEGFTKLAKTKAWDSIPREICAHLGSAMAGLVVMRANDYDALKRSEGVAAAREYERTHPGSQERQAIDDLYTKSGRALNGDYCDPALGYKLQAEADERLAAWKRSYPKEAAEKLAESLRSKADSKRELADGALTYDCDGSFDAAYRQERHDTIMAEATELDRQADAAMEQTR